MKDQSSQNSTSQNKLPWHRRWLATVWLAHGGGLYAVGYALTFLYLEARIVLTEVMQAEGLIDFITNQLIEFVFRFLGDSIANMVEAFIWFIPLLSYRSPLGIILLGIGFYVFDIYLREPVGNWLLREEPTVE